MCDRRIRAKYREYRGKYPDGATNNELRGERYEIDTAIDMFNRGKITRAEQIGRWSRQNNQEITVGFGTEYDFIIPGTNRFPNFAGRIPNVQGPLLGEAKSYNHGLGQYIKKAWSVLNFGRVSTYYVLMEGMHENGSVSPVIAPEVNRLKNYGFAVIPAETGATAPPSPSDDWVDNQRVPVANAAWTQKAMSLGDANDLVTICCGTSHVGPSRRKDGTAQEAGLIARLGGNVADGYAVIRGHGPYVPERDSPTWSYSPLQILSPF